MNTEAIDKAVVDYRENPTGENRERLLRVQAEYAKASVRRHVEELAGGTR